MGKTVMKILLVDDSADIRNSLKDYLKEKVSGGVEFCEADNGVGALKFLEAGDISLVITDLNMLEMDGIALTKKIRTEVSADVLPIIMLSARFTNIEPEWLEKAKSAGINAWVAKPFYLKDLEEKISSFVTNN